MIIDVPDAKAVFDSIRGVTASYAGQTSTIEQCRLEYLASVESNRKRPPLAIFNIFVSCLLERAMSGEAYERRHAAFDNAFTSYDDMTDKRVAQVLSEVGYRFPAHGKAVVLKAKAIVSAEGFSWADYFAEAEQRYADNYPKDQFLKVKYVGPKTRDLALSAFSTRFAAVDVHVTRVIIRTGLFFHGYSDPPWTAAGAYLFLRNLVVKLSHDTGWPEGGYSPGEIDRMLWNFGRAVCKGTPLCSSCPLIAMCLTTRQRRISPMDKG